MIGSLPAADYGYHPTRLIMYHRKILDLLLFIFQMVPKVITS